MSVSKDKAVARFYFHLNERGPTFETHEGLSHDDLDEARQQAVRCARTVVGVEAGDGELCVGCCVDVAHATGGTVVTVPLKEIAPVSGG